MKKLWQALVNVGQAILPADELSSASKPLKGGCGQDWPPHTLTQLFPDTALRQL
jgi:hypothetical protein